MMRGGGISRYKILSNITTFCLITIAWFFFRAGNVESLLLLIRHIFVFNWDIFITGSIYNLGVSEDYMLIVLIAISVLLFVDYQKYKGQDVANMILEQKLWFRMAFFIVLIMTNLLFGCYGELYDTQQFIYFQF